MSSLDIPIGSAKAINSEVTPNLKMHIKNA